MCIKTDEIRMHAPDDAAETANSLLAVEAVRPARAAAACLAQLRG